MKSRTALTLFALAFALAGCPHLPEPSGCQPRSYRCAVNPPGEPAGSHPEVCTNSQRWSRIGDVGCEQIPPGTARCVVEDSLAFCDDPTRHPAPASAPVGPRSAAESSGGASDQAARAITLPRLRRAVLDAAGAASVSVSDTLHTTAAALSAHAP